MSDTSTFLAAVVQMGATSDEQANWEAARHWIETAADRGARFVTTPENTNYLGPHKEKVKLAESTSGATCGRFAALARDRGIYLLLGSYNEKAPGENERCYNTSVLFDPQGAIAATYRKIHLFDVDVSDAVRFLESKTALPGADTVTVDTTLGRLGLTICYDLRFPELYLRLAGDGAEILTVPSAFTLMTGKDHWYPLLRARAIETQCYVLAAAQTGRHDDRGLRHSYGHSVIIDPWGHVLADAGDAPGIAIAEIDRRRVAEVRRSMPVAFHRRLPIG
jgi:predicted amidohydrolase